jgi:hypothetical protein
MGDKSPKSTQKKAGQKETKDKMQQQKRKAQEEAKHRVMPPAKKK